MIGRDLTDPPGRKTPDWDLALAVTQRACELRKYSDPSTLTALAETYHGKGDQSKAIETGELAVEKADADSIFPAGSTKYLKRRLEVFKTAQQTDAQKKAEK